MTVPNRLSLWEKLRRATYLRKRKELELDASGRPHVQFRTPSEWAEFFRKCNFTVVRHDMQIGFFVNDVWAGFYSVLSLVVVEPAFNPLLKKLLGRQLPPNFLMELFCPCWLMGFVHLFDISMKEAFIGRWGWNLFVLKRHNQAQPAVLRPSNP